MLHTTTSSDEQQKPMSGELIYQRRTKPVRIDEELHRLLKIKASEGSATIKELLESIIADSLYSERG